MARTIEEMYVAQPIIWTDGSVTMLDQRRLPGEEISYIYTDYREVAKAIREMVIRGAPAIGVAAAMGAALGVLHSSATSVEALSAEFAEICDTLAKTRPTAVDLFWALERMKCRFAELTALTSDLAKVKQAMVEEAQQIHLEKKATDEAIGRFGAEFMPREGQVMTQCNAGALATGGIGTALGVIRVAFEQGRKLHVLVPETRPYLQGARLTAWELQKGGIPPSTSRPPAISPPSLPNAASPAPPIQNPCGPSPLRPNLPSPRAEHIKISRPPTAAVVGQNQPAYNVSLCSVGMVHLLEPLSWSADWSYFLLSTVLRRLPGVVSSATRREIPWTWPPSSSWRRTATARIRPQPRQPASSYSPPSRRATMPSR